MFDWFKSREERAKEYDNVVKFPKPESVPYIEPPAEPEKPTTTYYRLGMTDNNRVSLLMGYSEITLNAGGINNLIKQLELFRDQLHNEEEDEQ